MSEEDPKLTTKHGLFAEGGTIDLNERLAEQKRRELRRSGQPGFAGLTGREHEVYNKLLTRWGVGKVYLNSFSKSDQQTLGVIEGTKQIIIHDNSEVEPNIHSSYFREIVNATGKRKYERLEEPGVRGPEVFGSPTKGNNKERRATEHHYSAGKSQARLTPEQKEEMERLKRFIARMKR